jgi:flavin-dependent dehydrogenase
MRSLSKALLPKMMMASSEFFDVIIIGGGPAGSAAAISLQHHGFRSALIERSAYCSPRVGETLPPAIHPLLRSLGVWQQFLSDGHIESFAIRSAWGSSEPRESYSICNPYGSGWHVDRARFDSMLAKAAANAGTILLTQARITHLSQDQMSGWQLAVLQNNRSRCLHAPFLIDASGKTATFFAGIPHSSHVIDHLIGVVRFFSGVAEPYILIEARSRGWWYSAPLPDGRLVVVHMTDADLFAGSHCSPCDYWRRQILEAELTYTRIGPEIGIAEPKIVSAASLIRRPVCGTNWIAAGDAALTFDPLSGRGVYNALKGGILAAEAINARFHGKGESFTEYTRWINTQFSTYLQMRNAFYNKEHRWPQSPFWRRRQSIATS